MAFNIPFAGAPQATTDFNRDIASLMRDVIKHDDSVKLQREKMRADAAQNSIVNFQRTLALQQRQREADQRAQIAKDRDQLYRDKMIRDDLGGRFRSEEEFSRWAMENGQDPSYAYGQFAQGKEFGYTPEQEQQLSKIMKERARGMQEIAEGGDPDGQMALDFMAQSRKEEAAIRKGFYDKPKPTWFKEAQENIINPNTAEGKAFYDTFGLKKGDIMARDPKSGKYYMVKEVDEGSGKADEEPIVMGGITMPKGFDNRALAKLDYEIGGRIAKRNNEELMPDEPKQSAESALAQLTDRQREAQRWFEWSLNGNTFRDYVYPAIHAIAYKVSQGEPMSRDEVTILTTYVDYLKVKQQEAGMITPDDHKRYKMIVEVMRTAFPEMQPGMSRGKRVAPTAVKRAGSSVMDGPPASLQNRIPPPMPTVNNAPPEVFTPPGVPGMFMN